MKQFSYIMEKLFGIVFLAFSIGLAICSFHGISGFQDKVLWKVICVVVILAFVSMASYAVKLSTENSSGEYYRNIANIFTLSLGAHLLVVWAVGPYTEQISDFASALALSGEKFPLTITPDHYRIFSNWAMYPLYLKLIQTLFGYGSFTGMVFNAIMSAFSSTFIYILCHLELKNDMVGYLAALIYTCWPAHLLYSIILTPEFINIFLILLFFIFMEIVLRGDRDRTVYIMTCLSALTLSLSGFFKSIDKIILLAIGIMVLLFIFKSDYLKSAEGGEQRKITLRKIAILGVLFLCCYFLFGKLIYFGLDYTYGATVNRNPTAHFIYVGLNPETGGTWNEEVGGLYQENILKCNYDYGKASDLTFEQLKNEIREQKYLTPVFFVKKFKIAWENQGEIFWVNETITDESPFLKKGSWCYPINMLVQFFWLLICIFLCIEAIYLLVQSNEFRMFFCLILFGFTCLMFLSEVQERYKCVMYPIISILVADAIVKLINTLKYACQNLRHYKC